MPVPAPGVKPGDWNVLKIDNLEMPGLAKVDVEVKSQLDIKKPIGANGATITLQGVNPAKVTITLLFLDEQQFARFQSQGWLEALRPKSRRGAATKVAFKHPKLPFWGIEAVVIETIRDHSGHETDGTYSLIFDCHEWRPPVAVSKTPPPGKIGSFGNALEQKPKTAPSQVAGTSDPSVITSYPEPNRSVSEFVTTPPTPEFVTLKGTP